MTFVHRVGVRFFFMVLRTRAFVSTSRAQSIFECGQILDFVKIGSRMRAFV